MTTSQMTSAERVVDFLTSHRGEWYCDACISVEAGVAPSNQVNQITRPLALTPEYQRSDFATCHRCIQTRKCIRYV